MNLAQVFNPIGAILGVLVRTRFIFSGVELAPFQIAGMQAQGTSIAYLYQETHRVIMPYLVIGGVALVWAAIIALTQFPKFIHDPEVSAESSSSWRGLLCQKHFLYAMFTQLMYVGVQVGTWSYFIQYSQEYAHLPERTAGLLLTCTLAAFGSGRFASASIMRRVAASKLMTFYALANILLLVLAIMAKGWPEVLAILLTSFFMSVMFPTIFALGLKDLGPNTNLGGSLLVMMIIGGAVMTPANGWLAGTNTGVAYVFTLTGYIAVAAFSMYITRHAPERRATSTFKT